MIPALRRLLLPGACALGALVPTQSARAQKPPRAAAPRTRQAVPRSFQLFAGAPFANAAGNRVYCGLTDVGNVCTDVTGSSILGGGSWPQGTPDQYLFNSGIQVAGMVAANAGFPWARDTVGAWAASVSGGITGHTRGVTGM